MSKHTPGPWKFETVKTQVGSCHKIGPLGKFSACIYVDGYVWPDDLGRFEEGRVSIANAKLMSAAPDLLEALKLTEKARQIHCDCKECEGLADPAICGECFPSWDAALTARLEAIAKAEAL